MLDGDPVIGEIMLDTNPPPLGVGLGVGIGVGVGVAVCDRAASAADHLHCRYQRQ